MIDAFPRVRGRAGAVAALLAVLALSVVACGDSGDGQDNANASQADGQDTTVSKQEQREQVVDTRNKLVDELYSGRGEAYCAGLTEAAAKRLIREHRTSDTCAGTIRKLVPKPIAPSARAAFRGRVVRVEVDGDEAVVFSRGVDGALDEVTFVKDGDTWKVDRYKAGNPKSAVR